MRSELYVRLKLHKIRIEHENIISDDFIEIVNKLTKLSCENDFCEA